MCVKEIDAKDKLGSRKIVMTCTEGQGWRDTIIHRVERVEKRMFQSLLVW